MLWDFCMAAYIYKYIPDGSITYIPFSGWNYHYSTAFDRYMCGNKFVFDGTKLRTKKLEKWRP